MKKEILLIISLASLLGACRQEERYLDEGKGMLCLQVTMDETVDVVSRASVGSEEAEALKEDCKVRIYENDKLIRKYSSWSAVPEKIDLAAGSDYKVRVVAGDSVSASFDKKYYEGVEPFSVTNGNTTSVEVNCNIVNTLVKVNFTEEMKTYLSSGNVNVAVDANEGGLDYAWSEENQDVPVGYYMLPNGKEYLTCVFTATTKSGKKITQTDVIQAAKSATLYTLTYAPSTETLERPTDEGGGFFTLKVDETPLKTQEEEVNIYRRPVVKVMSDGAEVSTDAPWFISLNATVSPEMTLTGSSVLTTATAEGSLLEKLGFQGSIDLLSEETASSLQQKGITLTVPTQASGRQIVMDWGNSWTELLKEEAIYSLKYTLADENGKQSTLDWEIVVSDMDVQTTDIPRFETWADRTVFYGEVIDSHTPAAGATFSFQYRKKGDGTWSQSVPATLSGQTIKSDVVKGLTPGTTYEYRILEDTKISNIVCEVTTEEALALLNSSFENWHQDGNTWYVFGSEEAMFWDSGNKGATTGVAALLGSNMTTRSSDYVHSGNYSACLKTDVVMSTVAAGNLFIGEFLGTEQTTKGILGWGRPWSVRPLALHGYVKYSPQAVQDSRLPDGQDEGIIYVAVGDWAGAAYNPAWPIVIRTANPDTDLFNPDEGCYTGDGIIAYGAKVLKGEVKGSNDGLMEFVIPLEYRSMTRVPTAIILVASASRYGDYYVGAKNSTMWLDDLELIYEESKLPENLR